MTPEDSRDDPEGSALSDVTRISRSPDVLTTEIDGEVLMMSIERGCYFSLNEVGLDIWRRLDTPRSFAELIDGLAADYDATRATIMQDVRALLGQMLAEDIVRIA
jgi:hypothetical protein